MEIFLFTLGAAIVLGWWIASVVLAAVATYRLWRNRRKFK